MPINFSFAFQQINIIHNLKWFWWPEPEHSTVQAYHEPCPAVQDSDFGGLNQSIARFRPTMNRVALEQLWFWWLEPEHSTVQAYHEPCCFRATLVLVA